MDLEDYLQQFRWRDPDPELKTRVLDAAAAPPRVKQSWPWLLGAAAALMLAGGLGYWIWLGTQATDSLVSRPQGEGEPVPVATLGGRGRVLPVEADTRFTVVDGERGRVHLERGQVYVELEPGTGAAEVE